MCQALVSRLMVRIRVPLSVGFTKPETSGPNAETLLHSRSEPKFTPGGPEVGLAFLALFFGAKRLTQFFDPRLVLT